MTETCQSCGVDYYDLFKGNCNSSYAVRPSLSFKSQIKADVVSVRVRVSISFSLSFPSPPCLSLSINFCCNIPLTNTVKNLETLFTHVTAQKRPTTPSSSALPDPITWARPFLLTSTSIPLRLVLPWLPRLPPHSPSVRVRLRPRPREHLM